MRAFLIRLLAFIASVLATAVIGSVFSTQFVIAALGSIDVTVPLDVRLATTFRDFGILPTLVPAVAASFLIGFLVAGICASMLGGSRAFWFALAGAMALVSELLIMQAVLGLMPVAGARTASGLASFAVAGAAGGWLFARLTRRTEKTEASIA